MKIVHFAPFAPWQCGLYEAARDMVVADMRAGHDTHIIDVGIMRQSKPGKVGKKDNRGGTEIISANPKEVLDADIIVTHSGIPDNWIVKCQTPIIFILHGRPAACFRPEQFGGRPSYTMTAQMAKWPRIKAMVTFWKYHVQFWDVIIPKDKLVCFPAPPIDEKRFSKSVPVHDFKKLGGACNIMIAESWREDVDIYEITQGVIESAKLIKGIKFHFYAMEKNVRCWTFLIDKLRELGIKGEMWARRTRIEEVYRAAHILLSPQRIVTRSVGEALSCGTPVIAARGCEYATWNMIPDEPKDVAETIKNAVLDISDTPQIIEKKVDDAAKALSLTKYSENMNKLYQRILA